MSELEYSTRQRPAWCDGALSHCRCHHPAAHHGPCDCPCGGSWYLLPGGAAMIVTLPEAARFRAAFRLCGGQP